MEHFRRSVFQQEVRQAFVHGIAWFSTQPQYMFEAKQFIEMYEKIVQENNIEDRAWFGSHLRDCILCTFRETTVTHPHVDVINAYNRLAQAFGMPEGYLECCL